jgi:hypothetical protein
MRCIATDTLVTTAFLSITRVASEVVRKLEENRTQFK